MNVALYARVSEPRIQDAEDKVSIDQQLADQRALCERNKWQIVEEFVDNKSYRATQSPRKGRIVNPSGERADRPQFLALLQLVKAGDIDTVLCWRDDRLVRHPRVAVVMEDALDLADAQRNGRPKIEIRDATGAQIDRFTLSIKATIWREENKRRAERVRMGKVATLKQGYWPGSYTRFGYKTRKGPRGRIIEMAEREAAIVRTIHEMYDAGIGIMDIRQHLIDNDLEQKGIQKRKHDWRRLLIYEILHAQDYIGIATWNFSDGRTMTIEIPTIVDRELWERNQARLERNKVLSPRNAKGVYLLQGLLYCGDCGLAMRVSRSLYHHEDGRRYRRKNPYHKYQCTGPAIYPDEPHPNPWVRGGIGLDWQVWRQLVDYGIKRPDLITAYVLGRQAELQAQGESVGGDIAHIRQKLVEVDNERAFYQRQAARGKMTEQEFDARMGETEESRQYMESELARLQELRDNQDRLQSGLDYANKLLTTLQRKLPEIDIPPDELKALPRERRIEVLKVRQAIARALVEKVEVWADGRVRIHGLLDGSEAAQFELGSL